MNVIDYVYLRLVSDTVRYSTRLRLRSLSAHFEP